MIFKLSAEVEFEADDITDAMVKLAMHFLEVAQGVDSTLFHGGEIAIKPVES